MLAAAAHPAASHPLWRNCSINWKCNWPTLRRTRPRTSWRRSGRRPRRWSHPPNGNDRPKPFPGLLPRERVAAPAPQSYPCCGSLRLSKLGEDVTETLEVVPRQRKVIQTVREPVLVPAVRSDLAAAGVLPRHAAPLRGPKPPGDDPIREVRPASAAEPPDERCARERVDLSLSTLADQVGRLRRGVASAARPGARQKGWLFTGSDCVAERAALMYTLIQTAKLNDVDPQPWLADVLARIAYNAANAARRVAPLETAAWASPQRSCVTAASIRGLLCRRAKASVPSTRRRVQLGPIPLSVTKRPGLTNKLHLLDGLRPLKRQ